MNSRSVPPVKVFAFLSGVCRHELQLQQLQMLLVFLSGVCRHEPNRLQVETDENFLSGVCRHER